MSDILVQIVKRLPFKTSCLVIIYWWQEPAWSSQGAWFSHLDNILSGFITDKNQRKSEESWEKRVYMFICFATFLPQLRDSLSLPQDPEKKAINHLRIGLGGWTSGREEWSTEHVSTLLYPVSLLCGCWDRVQDGDPLFAPVKCKLVQNGHSSPQQWSEQFTGAYMGSPPPTRWSIFHLFGQLSVALPMGWGWRQRMSFQEEELWFTLPSDCEKDGIVPSLLNAITWRRSDEAVGEGRWGGGGGASSWVSSLVKSAYVPTLFYPCETNSQERMEDMDSGENVPAENCLKVRENRCW